MTASQVKAMNDAEELGRMIRENERLKTENLMLRGLIESAIKLLTGLENAQ
jgi:hypothetical protein